MGSRRSRGRYFKWSADPNVQKWEESERPEGDKKSEAESEYKKTKYFLVPNYLVVLQNNAGKTKTEQKWELAAKTGDNKHVVNEKVEKLIAMGRIKEEVLPKVPGQRGAPPQTYVVLKPFGSKNGEESLDEE